MKRAGQRVRAAAVAVALCASALSPVAAALTEPLVPAEDPGLRRCGAASPGPWQQLDFDDSGWVHGQEPPDCDVLRVRRRFVTPRPGALAALALTVRYQDGLVAWINGVEVARRRYIDGEASASESHGGESERLTIALSPGMLKAGDNVLAIEVHPARPGRPPALSASLEGTDGPRIVRGPYLSRVLDGEARLIVDTDLTTWAEVTWSSAAPGAPERKVSFPTLGTHHVLRLDGLAPGRAYRYRVLVAAPGLPPATSEAAFHTPPTAAHPLRFVIAGDTRSGHDIHQQLVARIAAEDPDLVLMTGDLVNMGSDEAEWQRFFEIEQPLMSRVALYSALGNHDHWRSPEGTRRFTALFDRPPGPTWWSFDVAGVHFVLLDSDNYRDPAQVDWLRDDLAAAARRRPRAIFVCAHHGAFSAALHGDNPDAIRDYVPLLEAAHVTLLVSGHDHDYERGRQGSLSYLVSGGGGAELRPPRCGVPGRRRCAPRQLAFVNEHHYVDVEVRSTTVSLCPRRMDGTLLEPCVTLPGRP